MGSGTTADRLRRKVTAAACLTAAAQAKAQDVPPAKAQEAAPGEADASQAQDIVVIGSGETSRDSSSGRSARRFERMPAPLIWFSGLESHETKLGRDLYRPRPSHTHRKSMPLGEPIICADPARREIQDNNRAGTTESVNSLDS